MKFTADNFVADIEARLGQGGAHVWEYYKLKAGTPWCDGEISYTFQRIGHKGKWCGGKPSFYVPDAQAWMAKNYVTVYDYRKGGSIAKVEKGDIIIFMWSKGSRDHIGVCRKTTKSKATILTIEGNTSGGKVANRERAKKYIFAVYRPPYKAGSTDPEPDAIVYDIGADYHVAVDNLNIRKGPGTDYAVKKKADLSRNGQKVTNAQGQLMTGTAVTCMGVKQIGTSTWMEIPSGWVCAFNGSKYYIK